MGLFYQLAPNRTLCTNQQSGKKVSKKRITVAVYCNQDGSEYIKPIVINDCKKPRCFGRFEPGSLVSYIPNNRKLLEKNKNS
jgi:hypothetical protein